MKLKTDFKFCVAGSHGAIYVRTDEPDEALLSIQRNCEENGWNYWIWDLLTGLTKCKPGSKGRLVKVPGTAAGSSRDEDPLASRNNGMAGVNGATRAVKELSDFDNKVNTKEGEDYVSTILVLSNLHIVAITPETRQAIMNVVRDFKKYSKLVVGIGHAASDLPPELTPLFTIIDHELPEADDFMDILESFVRDGQCEKLETQIKDEICEAACGLTRLQFDNEVANQIAMANNDGRPRIVTTEGVWKRKCEILNAEGLVSVLKPVSGYDKLGGMLGVKKFVKEILNPQNIDPANPDMRANGVLLVSGPGMGKSVFIEAVAYELGCHAVMMDFGQMMGGIVGDTEKNTSRAFRIVEAMAPKGTGKSRKCLIVGWDEIEKMLSQGDTGLDSGVGVRQLGFVLKWLSTRTCRTFVIATANEARNLHSALTRAERFDALFYIEKPGRLQKDQIWSIYVDKFGLTQSAPCLVRRTEKNKPQFWNAKSWTEDVNQAMTYGTYTDAKEVVDEITSTAPSAAVAKAVKIVPKLPDDSDWTGAEIRSCCRLAAMQRKSIIEAATHIVPVFVRYKSNMESLENWARGCCLSSETGKRFGATVEASETTGDKQDKVRRRVNKLSDKPRPSAQPDDEEEADEE